MTRPLLLLLLLVLLLCGFFFFSFCSGFERIGSSPAYDHSVLTPSRIPFVSHNEYIDEQTERMAKRDPKDRLPNISVHWNEKEKRWSVVADRRLPLFTVLGEVTGRVRFFDPAAPPANYAVLQWAPGSGIALNRTVQAHSPLSMPSLVVDSTSEGNELRFLNRADSEHKANCVYSRAVIDGVMRVIVVTVALVQEGGEYRVAREDSWSSAVVAARSHSSSPPSWRSEIEYYLIDNVYESEEMRATATPHPDAPPSPVQVLRIMNPSHPVFGKFGVFSSGFFSLGAVVGEYTGTLVRSGTKFRLEYLAQLRMEGDTDEDVLAVDADRIGNEMRYINDFRNISTSHNCGYTAAVIGGERRVLVVVATEVVHPGQELLADYGESYWKAWRAERAASKASDDEQKKKLGGDLISGGLKVDARPPQAWPSPLRYVFDTMFENADILEALRQHFRRLPWVTVRRIDDEHHPAHGQVGVFATRHMPRFSIVGEYTGEVVPTNTVQDLTYVVELRPHGRSGFSVDGIRAGNEMPLINDYRGLAPSNNCRYLAATIGGLPRTFVTLMKDVAEGEELLADYGAPYWASLEKLKTARKSMGVAESTVPEAPSVRPDGQTDDFPSKLEYLITNRYSDLELARSFMAEAQNALPVALRTITEENDAAKGELSLFARHSLIEGAVLGEYAGFVRAVTNDIIDPQTMLSLEVFEVKVPNGKLVLDTSVGGNEFRFMRDYRGRAEEPNVRLYPAIVDALPRILVVAMKPLRAGMEIVVDYEGWRAEK